MYTIYALDFSGHPIPMPHPFESLEAAMAHLRHLAIASGLWCAEVVNDGGHVACGYDEGRFIRDDPTPKTTSIGAVLMRVRVGKFDALGELYARLSEVTDLHEAAKAVELFVQASQARAHAAAQATLQRLDQELGRRRLVEERHRRRRLIEGPEGGAL